MLKCGNIFVLSVILCCFTLIKCDLTIEKKKCGDKYCKRVEYCSPYHRLCSPCTDICDSSTGNFDASLCMKECQDYLHDSRYVIKDDIGTGNDTENLRATVQRLSHMVTVILTLVCFMLIALASVLFIQLYRWKKKKNITLSNIKTKFFSKKSDSSTTNKNSTVPNQSNNEKPDLRLEMPTESTHSGNSPVTVTTTISRRPAEDSTLDYAYDNPAMTASPGVKPENSF